MALYSHSPPQSHSPSGQSLGPSHWVQQGDAAARAAQHRTVSGGTLKARREEGSVCYSGPSPRPLQAHEHVHNPSQQNGIGWKPTLAMALCPFKEGKFAGVIHHHELAQQGLDDFACARAGKHMKVLDRILG